MQEHTYEWEVVVGVDQCSDASLAICQHYQALYPSLIRLIVHEERAGMIKNFVDTYNACTGKYIAMCEGDDYWTDALKIAKQVKTLAEDADAVISFTDLEILDEETGEKQPNWATIQKEKYTISDIIRTNTITTCTVMFRNGLVRLNSESFSSLQMADWPLYVELLTHGYAKYLDQKTAVYRRSAGGSFAKNAIPEQLQKKLRAVEYLQQLQALANERPLLKKAWNELAYAIAIRLPKHEPGRKKYLQQVIRNSGLNNPTLTLKAMAHSL